MANMAHRPTEEHGPGKCDCPKLAGVTWVDRTPTGREEAFLLAAAKFPQDVPLMEDMAGQMGLWRGVVVRAFGAMAHLDRDRSVTLAVGLERFGPVAVFPAWAALARRHGEVVVMIGTVPIPDGMNVDTYLEEYAERVGTGLVPVAGVGVPEGPGSEGRCAATITVPRQVLGRGMVERVDGVEGGEGTP